MLPCIESNHLRHWKMSPVNYRTKSSTGTWSLILEKKPAHVSVVPESSDHKPNVKKARVESSVRSVNNFREILLIFIISVEQSWDCTDKLLECAGVFCKAYCCLVLDHTISVSFTLTFYERSNLAYSWHCNQSSGALGWVGCTYATGDELRHYYRSDVNWMW